VLGRFVSADTVVPEPGNPQAFNRYSYVLGNPLKYVDPSGHYDLWSGLDNIWGVPEDPVVATHTHSGGYIQLLDHLQSPWNLAERACQELEIHGTLRLSTYFSTPSGEGAFSQGAFRLSAALYDVPSGMLMGVYGAGTLIQAYRSSEVAGSWIRQWEQNNALEKYLNEAVQADFAYRYVGEVEAEIIKRTGRIPNVNAKGEPKSVFTTTDYYETVTEAEQGLKIGRQHPQGPFEPPTHRVTYYRNSVRYRYAGNVEGGIGIEMVTDQSIRALRVDRLK